MEIYSLENNFFYCIFVQKYSIPFMKKILAFAGSNSKNSINKKLVIYTSSLIEECEVNLLDLNNFELPVFSVDIESEYGIPENAHNFLTYLKASDGILVSLAEHNGAYTAAFKNIFDWMSRIESKTFFNKPMLLMATSTGSRGGKSVLSIAQDRFPRHDAKIIEVFSLPLFKENFADGKITDSNLNKELKEKLKTFLKAV